MQTLSRNHYFDYAAAAPIRPEIAALYPEYCQRLLANPHGTSIFNHEGHKAVANSQERLLDFLGIPSDEADVIWTGSATEALNLAIRGWFPRRPPVIFADSTAHPAMLESCRSRAQSKDGSTLTLMNVTAEGQLIFPADIPDSDSTMLAICHLNNETGVVQDLSSLNQFSQAAICLDASQSLGRVAIPWNQPRLSFVTLSARKIGGPASLGALIFRRHLPMKPLIVGGGQQNNLRSGTLDAVSIALLAPTLDLLEADAKNECTRLRELNHHLRQGIKEVGKGAWPIISPESAHPAILAVSLPGYEAAIVARALAMSFGFQVSSGSACHSESPRPSHVLTAMGYDDSAARSVLRISLGPDSTADAIDGLLEALVSVLKDY